MGRKKYTEFLEPGKFYHVFNRGINGERIFSNSKNYDYFLTLFEKYILKLANVHCYCLLPNHFHFLIEILPEVEIKKLIINSNHSPEIFISKQFSHLFNSYSQAYNKSMRRTGRLFDHPFRRIPIDSEKYLRNSILYIHKNPIKHSISSEIINYPHSSYSKIIFDQPSFIQKDYVLELFDGLENFRHCHED